MTVTAFLQQLAKAADLTDPHLAERIRTAACATRQLEQDARIARRERARNAGSSNAELMYAARETWSKKEAEKQMKLRAATYTS